MTRRYWPLHVSGLGLTRFLRPYGAPRVIRWRLVAAAAGIPDLEAFGSRLDDRVSLNGIKLAEFNEAFARRRVRHGDDVCRWRHGCSGRVRGVRGVAPGCPAGASS